MTGTVFDNAKLPVTAWADFILQALSFESVSAMAREDRRVDTTSPKDRFYVLPMFCRTSQVFVEQVSL